MDSDAELVNVRRTYANQIMAAAMVDDERVEAAFAAVQNPELCSASATHHLTNHALLMPDRRITRPGKELPCWN